MTFLEFNGMALAVEDSEGFAWYRGLALGDRVLGVVKRLAAGRFEGQTQRLTTGEVVHSWPVPPFRIYYQRHPDELLIVRVYHQSRRPIAR